MDQQSLVRLEDFLFVPKDRDLCFYLADENGNRRYYRAAPFDLENLARVTDINEFCKIARMLRVLEHFPKKDLECQEPFIDSCILPELDPRQQPKKDMPDTTRAITKTTHEGEEQFKRDIGESL